MSRDIVRPLLGVATLVVVLALNGLAGSGALSGESIGVIANRFPSWFLPASYVFSIWSVIYLLLSVFVAYQCLPSQRDDPLLRRIGFLWPANGILNSAWVTVFAFGMYGASLVVMVLLLISLIAIHRSVGRREDLSRVQRLAVALPFETYLAWISVALIANSFQFASALGWDGLGAPASLWAMAMMAVATVVGSVMWLRRGVWVYPLVVAWALVGIGIRYEGTQPLAGVAWGRAVAGLAVGLFGSTIRGRGEADSRGL